MSVLSGSVLGERLRRRGWWLVGVGLVAAGLLLDPVWLVRLSPDGQFHPDTLLTLTFFRIFLVGLGALAPFWPVLSQPRWRGWLIVLLVILALTCRAVRLTVTYLDQHAHRQANVATIARNFYEKDPNILLPQVNWRADAPNYIESTFPLLAWLTALGYRVVGEQPWVGRSLVALCAALGVVAIFGLVSLYWGQAAGFFAALFVALSPLGIYFGRALIDDTGAIALALTGLWGIAAWAQRDLAEEGHKRHWWLLILALIALTLGILIKIVTAYIFVPVAAVVWDRWRRQAVRQLPAWVIFVAPLVPIAGWYGWAHVLGLHYLSFGIGAPASYETVSKWGSAALVLRWDFVQRIGDRVLHQILTPAMVIPLLLGAVILLRRRSSGSLVSGALLLGVVLFTAISGQAQWLHNYYQLPYTTALAPFVGLGLALAWSWRVVGRLAALGLLLLLAVFSARLMPYYYYDWQGWILDEVPVVQALAGPNDPVITVTMESDTALLYQLHRPGWVVDLTDPAAVARVPEHIAYGAKVLVLQDLEYPEAKSLPAQPWVQGLERVAASEHYQIYRIPQPGP